VYFLCISMWFEFMEGDFYGSMSDIASFRVLYIHMYTPSLPFYKHLQTRLRKIIHTINTT